MGKEGDIIRLECQVIKDSHFRALTAEQWIAYYAPRFRDRVNEILKKTGKLPTKEQIIIDLSA